MASHSCSVTVEVAPEDSAVSVVGTGVELGARADAIAAMEHLVLWCCAVVSLLWCWGCRVVDTKSRLERSGAGVKIIRECLSHISASANSRVPEHSLAPCHLFAPTVASSE